MNELQRMQYLEALGVDSYMPRRALPGAPAAQPCRPVVTVAAEPAAAPVVAAPVSGAANDQVLAPLAAVLNTPSPSPSPAATPPPSSPSPAQPAANIQARPRFSLGLWVIEQELLVIDSREPQRALPTERLLANLLLALGYGGAPLPRVEVFQWPLHEGIVDALDEHAAREALAAMLEGRLERQPLSRCLLLGAEACYYALPRTAAEAAVSTAELSPESLLAALDGQALALQELALQAVVLPSLADLLQQPERKAAAWRALQSLRRRS